MKINKKKPPIDSCKIFGGYATLLVEIKKKDSRLVVKTTNNRVATQVPRSNPTVNTFISKKKKGYQSSPFKTHDEKNYRQGNLSEHCRCLKSCKILLHYFTGVQARVGRTGQYVLPALKDPSFQAGCHGWGRGENDLAARKADVLRLKQGKIRPRVVLSTQVIENLFTESLPWDIRATECNRQGSASKYQIWVGRGKYSYV
jgi:hypothetical protein